MSEKQRPRLWRQGDLLIQETNVNEAGRIPVKLEGGVLFRGEASGRSHKLADKLSAKAFFVNRNTHLEVASEGADIVHDEHGPIHLKPGVYRYWRQREFIGEGRVYSRPVAD